MKPRNTHVGRLGALVAAIFSCALGIAFLLLFATTARAAEAPGMDAPAVLAVMKTPAPLVQMSALHSGRPLALLAILGGPATSGYTAPGGNAGIMSPLSVAEIDTDLVKGKTATPMLFKDSSGNLELTITNGVAGTITAQGSLGVTSGMRFVGGSNQINNSDNSATFQLTSSTAIAKLDAASLWINTVVPFTNNGNYVVKDQSGNTLATVVDQGTTGDLQASGNVIAKGGHLVFSAGSFPDLFNTSGTASLETAVADGGTAIGLKIGNSTALNTTGAKIVAFYNDALSTEKASIGKDGTITAANTFVSNGGVFTSASGTNEFRGNPAVVTDLSDNVIASFFDDGSTGSMTVSGTKTKGSVTLNADGTTNSTVTVNSGAKCLVGDESGNGVIGNPGFSVTTTTLTILNNAVNKGHVIDYHCF